LGLKIDNGETHEPISNAIIVENSQLHIPSADGGYQDLLYTKDDNGNYTTELQAGASVTPLGTELSEIVYIETKPVQIDLQEILDGVLPSMIPLALTLMLYLLLAKKKWTPIACICLILVIGILGALPAAFGGTSIW
jgi:PTS system N-acetylgalactosamine-specific IID component